MFWSFQAFLGAHVALLLLSAFNFLCALLAFLVIFSIPIAIKINCVHTFPCTVYHTMYIPDIYIYIYATEPRPTQTNQSNLLPLPCAILIYLSKFVKKLYEFYLWPAHAAHGRLPRPARPLVWTTSVSISCYRLFPPNLHTQNNLTVQRRYSMPSPFSTYLSLFHLSFISCTLSLWAAAASPQGRRDLCAAPINFHLVRQLGLPVSLSLSIPFSLPLGVTSAFH